MGLQDEDGARLSTEVHRILGPESQSRFALRNMDDAWNGWRHGVPPKSERWAGERCLYILRLTLGSQYEDLGESIPGAEDQLPSPPKPGSSARACEPTGASWTSKSSSWRRAKLPASLPLSNSLTGLPNRRAILGLLNSAY